MATPSNPTAAVLDASAAVAYAAREPGRFGHVASHLAANNATGRDSYAPGLIVGETLHVLCKKLARGELDATTHAAAVVDLIDLMNGVRPPPGGEAGLIAPAARLGGGYTCAKSNDSLYLALAERLVAAGEVVEVVTFDDDQAKWAERLPGVTGRRLPDS
ncbi:MAG: PIN domain-containing protein [Gemmataceae bacterium]|nr:PIN domain-containing protein [Gemmataceae bacterium]